MAIRNHLLVHALLDAKPSAADSNSEADRILTRRVLPIS